jgi:ATP-dependent NAD(P)H-hydrate dehydratase
LGNAPLQPHDTCLPERRDKSIPASRFPLLAAVGGSVVTRTTSRRAFSKEGRGVVTQDMLPEIGKAFAEVFGEEAQGQDKGKL